MIFRHTQDDIIYVNDLIIPLNIFLDLEPDYKLPDGCISRYYEPKNKHFLVTSSGLKKLPLKWVYGDIILNRYEEYCKYYDTIKNFM